jgi:hypothetical protein
MLLALEWVGQGERIYALGGICLVLLLAAMAIGPAKSYAAAGDRVEQLTHSRVALQYEVDRLEERRLSLRDPQELEVLARERFGLVRPGEIPYIVIRPDGGLDDLPIALPEPAPVPWYRRLLAPLRIFG